MSRKNGTGNILFILSLLSQNLTGFETLGCAKKIQIKVDCFTEARVAHWYAICFEPGGPGFKSLQELLVLNKKEELHHEEYPYLKRRSVHTERPA